MKPVTIVGGGLAGLAAANALADSGAEITLIERAHTLGGRARTTNEHGYSVNFGPHALYKGGVTNRMLAEWGISLKASAPAPGPLACFVKNGERIPFVRDIDGILTNSADVRAVDSVETWLTRQTSSEDTRASLRTVFRVSNYADDLTKLSARAGLDQVAMSRDHGVLYVDGGWQSIVEALASRARAKGVEIRCGEPVTDLAAFAGSKIILAVPPFEVERLTGKKLEGLVPVKMSALTLGLRRLPEGSALFALGVDRPLYLSVHSSWARVAPEGAALVHLGTYGGGTREELEQFADLLLPNWRDEVEVAQFLPSMVVMYGMPTTAGRPDVDTLGGILIAGDWVGPTGLLGDAATASGLRAAAKLCGAGWQPAADWQSAH
jgi:hypothetical protein